VITITKYISFARYERVLLGSFMLCIVFSFEIRRLEEKQT